ncbi:MAG: hypothetical protein LKE31_05270 [Bacilli bacterium]|jgi:hypothetical protein|nr:hypothetical protein [Bacilli bacterium]
MKKTILLSMSCSIAVLLGVACLFSEGLAGNKLEATASPLPDSISISGMRLFATSNAGKVYGITYASGGAIATSSEVADACSYTLEFSSSDYSFTMLITGTNKYLVPGATAPALKTITTNPASWKIADLTSNNNYSFTGIQNTESNALGLGSSGIKNYSVHNTWGSGLTPSTSAFDVVYFDYSADSFNTWIMDKTMEGDVDTDSCLPNAFEAKCRYLLVYDKSSISEAALARYNNWVSHLS